MSPARTAILITLPLCGGALTLVWVIVRGELAYRRSLRRNRLVAVRPNRSWERW